MNLPGRGSGLENRKRLAAQQHVQAAFLHAERHRPAERTISENSTSSLSVRILMRLDAPILAFRPFRASTGFLEPLGGIVRLSPDRLSGFLRWIMLA